MQIRNAITLADGRIDCEIEHPTLGWLPFTAGPNDVEAHGRAIFVQAQSIATPYTPPSAEELEVQAAAAQEAVRSRMELSFAQMLIGLVTEAWITEAEGRAWRDRQAVPAPVQALIASLPAEQQFAAETRAIAPSIILRTDPLVNALGQAQGKTAEELDTFFTTYAAV